MEVRATIKEFTNKITSQDTYEKAERQGYMFISSLLKGEIFRHLTDGQKVRHCLEIVHAVELVQDNISKEYVKRKNKKFREIPIEYMLRRKSGEEAEFPKSFRYWYYYGKNESFFNWFNERVKELYIASDISMLACTVRDQYKKGLNRDDAKKAIDILWRMEKDYDTDVLRDVKGIDLK